MHASLAARAGRSSRTDPTHTAQPTMGRKQHRHRRAPRVATALERCLVTASRMMCRLYAAAALAGTGYIVARHWPAQETVETDLGALWKDGRPYYVGPLRDGLPHGDGALVSASRAYSGELALGLPHGHGQQLTRGPDADMHYVGTFDRGERSGRGTCYWDEGGAYTGEWRHGNMHGQGTMTYISGRSWTGTWRFGARHGEGVLRDPEGYPLPSRTRYAYGLPVADDELDGPAAVFPWPESEVIHAGHATLALTSLNTSLGAADRMLLFRAMGSISLRGLRELAV